MSENKDLLSVAKENKETKSSKEKAINLEEQGSYPMHDFHAEVWNSNGTHFDKNTPIARAWSRLIDRDAKLGPPVGEQYRSLRGDIRQLFLYSIAEFNDNEEENPNKAVIFYDARGVVGTESGL